jgi:hypothetical protein
VGSFIKSNLRQQFRAPGETGYMAWQGGDSIENDELQRNQLGRQEGGCGPEVVMAMRQCIQRSGCAVDRGNLPFLVSHSATCVKDTVITDALEIAKSTAICRVVPGDTMDLCGDLMTEKSGAVRGRATSRVDGKSGWVTLRGNGGSSYVVPHSHPIALGFDNGALAPVGRQAQGGQLLRAQAAPLGHVRGVTHHHHPDHAEHSVHEDMRHHYYARHQSPPLLGPRRSEAEQGSGWRGSAGFAAAVSLPSHPSRHGYYGDRGPSRAHSPTSFPVVSGDEIGR